MVYEINFIRPVGNPGSVKVDKVPNECPTCKRTIDPGIIQGVATKREGDLQIAFHCTHAECRSILIGYYDEMEAPRAGDPESFHYAFSGTIRPVFPEEEEFPKEINEISENFYKIYNQAGAAEQRKLDEIAGAGYRKALEFLVKDYAISNHPNDADKIKETPLSACIKKYIDDQRIQDTAERAVWLGNDETHYYREWKNHDITDLKRLKRVTVNWIENVIITEQAKSEMQKRKKGSP